MIAKTMMAMACTQALLAFIILCVFIKEQKVDYKPRNGSERALMIAMDLHMYMYIQYTVYMSCTLYICSHTNKRHHSNWVVRTQVNIRFAHGVYSVPRPTHVCKQCQQYRQRDPLPELARLSIPGERTEHREGVRKARNNRWLVYWNTTNSMRDPLPEVSWRSIPAWQNREHSKSKKHDNNLYASSGTSQSNHPQQVFTNNTHDSLDINHSGFALGIYPELSCVLPVNTLREWYIHYVFTVLAYMYMLHSKKLLCTHVHVLIDLQPLGG